MHLVSLQKEYQIDLVWLFPYNEMVQEWNGSWVHISEFEPKQPQLEPLPIVTDPQSLQVC